MTIKEENCILLGAIAGSLGILIALIIISI